MSESPVPARIHTLPGPLINQIAAGEVIERPASVIKELVENAIDAGARRIEIDLGRGGCELIRIQDDGTGIHPDDMTLAVTRHATSKLHDSDDLAAIGTLGFRGEALASIASVADLTLTSRVGAESAGRRLRVDPLTGEVEMVPAARDTGTTVEVANLFLTVPARRKFLRSDRTEFLQVIEMLRRLVLSRSTLAVVVRQDGRTVLAAPAGDETSRIEAVMGQAFIRHARRFDTSARGMRLSGWLGGAQDARSQSDRQYLFLNGRSIRDRRLNHAIRMALEPVLPEARYPSYVLYLDMDPAVVDVNVHPAKLEVRFRDLRSVHDFVHAALNEVLGGSPAHVALPTSHTSAGRDYGHGYAPAGAAVSAFYSREIAESGAHSEAPLAVLDNQLALCRHDAGLRVVNYRRLRQHALRQRLLPDSVQGASRPLLVPVTLRYTGKSLQRLLDLRDVFARLGLNIEAGGPENLIVRAVPVATPDLPISAWLDAVLELEPGRTGQDELAALCDLLVTMVCEAMPTDPVSLQREWPGLLATDLPFDQPALSGFWYTLDVDELQRRVDVP